MREVSNLKAKENDQLAKNDLNNQPLVEAIGHNITP